MTIEVIKTTNITKCWKCEVKEAEQRKECDSFIGGKPKLPLDVELPKCALCGNPLTFFFQIAFPPEHAWHGKSLALFYCTEHYHGKYCIPEFPNGELLDITLTQEFLDSYERNFCTIVFDTASSILRDDYKEKVLYKEVLITPSKEEREENSIFQLGGKPIWTMDIDETPKEIKGIGECTLLMQIKEDYEFDKIMSAPPQETLFGTPSDEPNYRLFVCDRVYFWGARDDNRQKVYISVQEP